MTFFLDNNLPPQFAKILCMLDIDAYALRDLYRPDILDPDWIPEVANRGWFIVTCDLRIKRRKHEKHAYQQAGAIVVGIHSGFMKIPTIREKLVWLLRRWGDIEQAVQLADKGTFLVVPQKGKVARA